MARITIARVGDALFRPTKGSAPRPNTLKVVVQGDFGSLSPRKIAVTKAEFIGRPGSNTKTTYCCKGIRVRDDYAVLTLRRVKTTRSVKGSKNMIAIGVGEPVSGIFTVSLKLGPPGSPVEEQCWFDAVEYVE